MPTKELGGRMRIWTGVIAIAAIVCVQTVLAQPAAPIVLQCEGSLGDGAALRVGPGVLQRHEDGAWGENLCSHPYITCGMSGAAFTAQWEAGNGQASDQSLRLDLASGVFRWIVGGEAEEGRCTPIPDPAR